MKSPGRRFPKGVSGNPRGRPKGAKDKRPRASMRAIITALVEAYRGDEQMTEALHRILADYLEKPTAHRGRLVLALGELWAKVVDRVDEKQEGLGAGVTINVLGIDPMKLRPGGMGAPQALARSNKAGRGPRRQR